MNIIILAAGVGSRLYPLTKNTPKSMLKIDENQTILERTISTINNVSNKTNIKIVIGFKGSIISDKMANIECIENPFFRITNSIASLWFARSMLNDEVIIINSDVCFEEDLFREIIECKKENFVLLDNTKKCSDADYKVVTQNELVVNMGKSIPHDAYFGEYAGITKLNKKGAQLLKEKIDEMVEREDYDTWYETALVNLIKENYFKLSYLNIQGKKWLEIDTAKDLEYAKIIFSK